MSIDNWDATQAGLAVSRLVLVAILVVSAVLALVSAVLFQAPALLGQEKALTDFDVFYIAGTMENHGQANETYNISDTLAAQQSITGTQSLMPWTYPPPYLLLVGVLARMPVGLAYLLFTASSFAFYLLVLRRIAGDHLTGVLIAILPTVLITIRTGQNGFLTGGLVGCFLLAFMRDRTIAGVPLGLMVLKPHLAGGLALLSLLKRRWTVIATATVIVVISLAISTGVFGPGIWVAFLHGAREAGRFLLGGAYPLFRMSSIYAAVRSFGVPASLALAANFAVALGGVLLPLVRVAVRLRAARCCGSGLRRVVPRQPVQPRLRSDDLGRRHRLRAASDHGASSPLAVATAAGAVMDGDRLWLRGGHGP